MRIDQIASIALGQIFKRILVRALLAAVLGLFALIAIYHFTVAGTLALEAHFGLLYARLIIAGIYTAVAAGTFLTLWLTRAKLPQSGKVALDAPREAQIVMLVEAAMLGYSLARKGERAR
jgi:hypothetical protein